MDAKEIVQEQKKPTPNSKAAVWDLVIEDMKARDVIGLERHGTRLQPFNGRKPLIDAYQEALDQVVYLRQEIEQQTHPLITSVFLDMDGVLVDFMSGALKAHGAGRERLTRGEWDFAKCLGLTQEEFWAKCKGHSYWEGLLPLHDWLDILDVVRNAAGFDRVWLLSSPSHDPGCLSGKYAWLGLHLPGYQRKLILAPDKRPLARPGALLIDDSETNCAGFRAAGGEAFLFPRPWNHLHAEAHLGLDALLLTLKAMSYRLA